MCDAWFDRRRVALFEELVDGGRRILARFRQELGSVIHDDYVFSLTIFLGTELD